MSLDPPKVLLERSFLDAVLDPQHPRHDDCVGHYRSLLDQYEREELLLVAVGTDLLDVEHGDHPSTNDRVRWFVHRRRGGVFAPVDPLYVGFQHRRAASRVQDADPTVALTLVMCDRHKVRRVATVNEAYDRYDLEPEISPAG